MIRWRVYRAGGRMRTVTKMQIMAAVLVGFFLGYVLLPSTISFSTGEADQGDLIGKGFYNAKPRAAAIQISSDGREFIVEGRAKRTLSGAIHYFRVVPDYWDDRLRKMRASGLNTVETHFFWYVSLIRAQAIAHAPAT